MMEYNLQTDNSRRRAKAVLLKLIIFIILASLLIPLVAFANGAKRVENPSGNGGLIFDENSGVALTQESITFRVAEAAHTTQAEVTVEYELKNLMSYDQSFNMFFVIPPRHSSYAELWHKVSLNGEDITGPGLSSYKSISLPDNWFPTLPQGLLEPYSKRPYNSKLEDEMEIQYRVNGRQIEGIDIPVAIKANETAKLSIQYICEGGYYINDRYEKPIYSYIYYMTPARFWNGEPKIKLDVFLPVQLGSYRFFSDIPMKKAANNHYFTEIDKLPEHEWAFTFVNSKGLLYGTNSSEGHTIATIIVSILIFLAAYVLYRRKGDKLYILVGYILSVIYLFLFIGKIIDGYIMDIFIWMIMFIVFAIVIPFSYHVFSRLVNKNM